MSFNLDEYNTVAERIAEFRTKYPNGSLQPADPSQPFTVQEIGDRTFLVYVAAAYRSPDDARPGIGAAWEQFPGRTNYTRDSELQNAETSAWGRAIVAALAADTKKGIASAEDVRNRRAEQDAWDQAAPAQPASGEQAKAFVEWQKKVAAAKTEDDLAAVGSGVKAAERDGAISHWQYERLARAAAERMAGMRAAEQTPEVEP